MEDFSSSVPYYRDDITWCVSRAKPIPVFFNIWQLLRKEIWILLFALGYVHGSVIYILMKHDKNYNCLRRDFHYTVLLVSLPAIIGYNQAYQPKASFIRIIYISMLLFGIIQLATFNSYLLKVLTFPIHHVQITTVNEIIENNYELVGGKLSLHRLLMQRQVS